MKTEDLEAQRADQIDLQTQRADQIDLQAQRADQIDLQAQRADQIDLQAQRADLMTFTFGDCEELCNELLNLVRSGRKTATCEALREFGPEGDAMPVVGRRDVAHNWDATLALILETLAVTQMRFCDVDECFALAEGENDDLDGWSRDHQRYFERNGGFDSEIMLVCEHFMLVHDYGSRDS